MHSLLPTWQYIRLGNEIKIVFSSAFYFLVIFFIFLTDIFQQNWLLITLLVKSITLSGSITILVDFNTLSASITLSGVYYIIGAKYYK